MHRLLFAAALAFSMLALPVRADDVANLQKTDVAVGHGRLAHSGDTVAVNYAGWLYDARAADHRGAEFDRSEAGAPVRFVLGARQVIDGWDRGIAGMRVGGKRTLVIPARLAYGSRGAGDDIPPDAALVFEVELVGVN